MNLHHKLTAPVCASAAVLMLLCATGCSTSSADSADPADSTEVEPVELVEDNNEAYNPRNSALYHREKQVDTPHLPTRQFYHTILNKYPLSDSLYDVHLTVDIVYPLESVNTPLARNIRQWIRTSMDESELERNFSFKELIKGWSLVTDASECTAVPVYADSLVTTYTFQAEPYVLYATFSNASGELLTPRALHNLTGFKKLLSNHICEYHRKSEEELDHLIPKNIQEIQQLQLVIVDNKLMVNGQNDTSHSFLAKLPVESVLPFISPTARNKFFFK